MKAFKYLRVSSQIQDTQRQHTAIDSYSKLQGIEIIGSFEEKESGKNRQRQALTKMLTACKVQKPDLIIIDELSRLGRTSEVLTTIEELALIGVNVHTIKENLDSLNEDGSENTNAILSFYINAGMYRTELVTSKRRMKGGIVSAAERGQFQGGKNIPYGFKITMKPQTPNSNKIRSFLEINEEEKPLIEGIFNKYLAGLGCMKIALWLNQTEYKTRTGKPWGIPVIYAILKNKLYTGVRVMPTGQEIASYPQIISTDTFEAVQELLKGKNKQDIHKKFEYLLDCGLVKCGVCGMNFFGNKTTRGQNNVYCCLSRKRTYTLPVCGNYGVNINNFENSVQDILIKYLPTKIKDNINTNEIDSKINDLKQELSIYEQQLKQELRKEGDLLKLSLNGIFSADLIAEQAKEIQKNQQQYKATIAALNQNLTKLIQTKENTENLPAFINQLKKSGINKDLLRKLVNSIVVYPAKDVNLSGDGRDRTVEIKINIVGGGEISYYLGQRLKTYQLIQAKNLSIIEGERTKFQVMSDFKKPSHTIIINEAGN